MTWCNDCSDTPGVIIRRSSLPSSNDNNTIMDNKKTTVPACPSCGHRINCYEKARIHDLPGLPAGVKFDPSDHELLEHLEAKVRLDAHRIHPLIDEFIPTVEGENGICYTHPEKLPGVSKDGLVRHFFHRPSKAYTTGTRKRRKVHCEIDGSETRWHKTGKTRPVLLKTKVKGYKKILVLYANYGKQKKPEKTNWVMHQYHLGNNEDEKEGELVVSKIFYQTQPRQCGSNVVKDNIIISPLVKSNGRNVHDQGTHETNNTTFIEYITPSLVSFQQNLEHNNHDLNLHDGSLAVP